MKVEEEKPVTTEESKVEEPKDDKYFSNTKFSDLGLCEQTMKAVD